MKWKKKIEKKWKILDRETLYLNKWKILDRDLKFNLHLMRKNNNKENDMIDVAYFY